MIAGNLRLGAGGETRGRRMRQVTDAARCSLSGNAGKVRTAGQHHGNLREALEDAAPVKPSLQRSSR